MDTQRTSRERGQILVLFALSLVAIVGMVGLILDSGGAFAQRRSMQNAADVAALAAANDLIANQGDADWVGTAESIASLNGYADTVSGASVVVTCVNCPGQALDPAVDGVQVTVNITAPHRNNFSSILGMPTWDVSTTATSMTGWANTAHAPGPFIVSEDAFNDGGDPIHCTDEIDECDLEHADDDTPQVWTEFTWTDFGYDLPGAPCPPDGEPFEMGNVNDSDLQDYMDGSADFSVTLEFGCYIAQHNLGTMNNIVERLHCLTLGDDDPTCHGSGTPTTVTFPVPIVDEEGKYVGWASFVMTDAVSAGENSTITGYFETGRILAQLDVSGAGFGDSTFGSAYVVQLVN
jgi:Flp pilus assembly protein TadG